ncbi:transcriptional regulator (plasmid) [Pseudomonas sp. FeN3W]|uniref:helix-turn-helix domain-containing protein n=1 Tax=Stutzerimonas frequens TaxID=2968969 RepID=UPI00190D6F6A|nr:transcriptional regulator [Stutzerimonas frequens]MBK3760481.1 helix-turn-helix domain-containing protein [Stutzerimonas frequens]WOF81811.1 transcriptional regulator [Pseudomonas sp. FeN3W]
MSAKKMRLEKVLGQVLRDARLQAGLTRTECGEVLHISNLSQIENGQTLPRIDTLAALCKVLGVAPSDVLLVVEARCSGLDVEEQIVLSNKRLRALLSAGRFESVVQEDALRGIRGRKADSTRDSVKRMQGEGLQKDEIARRLGVTLRTVQRYWARG